MHTISTGAVRGGSEGTEGAKVVLRRGKRGRGGREEQVSRISTPLTVPAAVLSPTSRDVCFGHAVALMRVACLDGSNAVLAQAHTGPRTQECTPHAGFLMLLLPVEAAAHYLSATDPPSCLSSLSPF